MRAFLYMILLPQHMIFRDSVGRKRLQNELHCPEQSMLSKQKNLFYYKLPIILGLKYQMCRDAL